MYRKFNVHIYWVSIIYIIVFIKKELSYITIISIVLSITSAIIVTYFLYNLMDISDNKYIVIGNI